MTNEELAAWLKTTREICERATPGPWRVGGPFPAVSVIVGHDDECWPVARLMTVEEAKICADQGQIGDDVRNEAACIAHARTALPQALDIIDELLADLEQLRLIKSAAEEWLEMYKSEKPPRPYLTAWCLSLLEQVLFGQGPAKEDGK